jgi:AMP-binding enzyme C-terminal domain
LTPSDVDFAEVHDATSFSEIYQAEMMGFCEQGKGGAFVESGATRREGELPINMYVYPGEVERAILAHPSVQDCVVVGVPDDKWGEAIKAVIEIKPGCELGEAEIISLCKNRLGSVKAPKSVEFRSLPRTPVGKIDAKAVRAEYWRGLQRVI